MIEADFVFSPLLFSLKIVCLVSHSTSYVKLLLGLMNV